MKWGILILAILAFLVGPANLFATEQWERILLAEGWVKLNFSNFPEKDRVNTTWFGHGKSKSGITNYEGWLFHISSDGEKIFLFRKDANFSDRGTREVTKDQVCYFWETSQGGKKKCSPRDWTLWKKGKITMMVWLPFGTEMGRYVIEKGNPQNFKWNP